MLNLQRQWTVSDIHALPDDGNRYEVIDGELFVSPSPTLRHQYAVGKLFALLLEYLEREQVGYPGVAPADVIFSESRAVQPDVFVVPLVNARPPETFEDVGHLLVAAEVLSPSTARADRMSKKRLYRDQQVLEYWIVDLKSRTFERNTSSEARTEILADVLTWYPVGASAPLVIDLVAYFASVLD